MEDRGTEEQRGYKKEDENRNALGHEKAKRRTRA